MDLHLAGRRILVTGATGGIGRTVALTLAAEGADLALASRRAGPDLLELAAELEGSGSLAVPIAMDLEDLHSVRSAVTQAATGLGALDGLVNCAVRWGQWRDRIEEAPDPEWQPHLRANLEGVFVLVQAAAPHLRRSNAGRVVLVSSTLAEKGMIGSWVYATAKAGGHGLARGLAWDLGRDDVLVNTVMPGVVLVNGEHRSIPGGELPRLAAQQPAGRLPADQDVADVIAYLVSPRNRVISGEIVPITGGTP